MKARERKHSIFRAFKAGSVGRPAGKEGCQQSGGFQNGKTENTRRGICRPRKGSFTQCTSGTHHHQMLRAPLWNSPPQDCRNRHSTKLQLDGEASLSAQEGQMPGAAKRPANAISGTRPWGPCLEPGPAGWQRSQWPGGPPRNQAPSCSHPGKKKPPLPRQGSRLDRFTSAPHPGPARAHKGARPTAASGPLFRKGSPPHLEPSPARTGMLRLPQVQRRRAGRQAPCQGSHLPATGHLGRRAPPPPPAPLRGPFPGPDPARARASSARAWCKAGARWCTSASLQQAGVFDGPGAGCPGEGRRRRPPPHARPRFPSARQLFPAPTPTPWGLQALPRGAKPRGSRHVWTRRHGGGGNRGAADTCPAQPRSGRVPCAPASPERAGCSLNPGAGGGGARTLPGLYPRSIHAFS